ncbi:MAG TPA: TspO/MBR family protein [Sedimentisphaerales bacterium]|nr:TspO/MBR family protein [Sedimentisphaerales bacterium]
MSGKNALQLIAACGVSLGAGVIGSLASGPAGFQTWYAAIRKPSFTPPGWVFGPVWTILYILMGVAAFLVWRKGLDSRAVRAALAWFLGQLILNALWFPAFFGWHRIGLALMVLVLLWIVLAVTLRRFAGISRAAAGLLVPYLARTSFAGVLNASIWWLNR